MSALLVLAATTGAVAMFQLGAQSAWLAMAAILIRLLIMAIVLAAVVAVGRRLRGLWRW